MIGRIRKIYRAAELFLAAFFLLIFIVSDARASEHAETERFLRRKVAPPVATLDEIIKKKDEWYVEQYYEPSTIRSGSITGRWSEFIEKFGYIHNNIHAYMWFTQIEKAQNDDYLFNVGAYYNFKNSYVHHEIGFGGNDDFVYRFQNLVTLGVRMYKDLFWQAGYVYRDCTVRDTHIVYPGLVYRFGDNLINVTYAASYIEGRSTANQGLVRGDFAITEFMKLSGGVAFGERLFDAAGLDARQEQGYLIFGSVDTAFYKHLHVKIGYSYGREDPKFIKHSMNFALTLRF